MALYLYHYADCRTSPLMIPDRCLFIPSSTMYTGKRVNAGFTQIMLLDVLDNKSSLHQVMDTAFDTIGLEMAML